MVNFKTVQSKNKKIDDTLKELENSTLQLMYEIRNLRRYVLGTSTLNFVYMRTGKYGGRPIKVVKKK